MTPDDRTVIRQARDILMDARRDLRLIEDGVYMSQGRPRALTPEEYDQAFSRARASLHAVLARIDAYGRDA